MENINCLVYPSTLWSLQYHFLQPNWEVFCVFKNNHNNNNNNVILQSQTCAETFATRRSISRSLSCLASVRSCRDWSDWRATDKARKWYYYDLYNILRVNESMSTKLWGCVYQICQPFVPNESAARWASTTSQYRRRHPHPLPIVEMTTTTIVVVLRVRWHVCVS
jgi:hypothetical protein